MVDTYIRIENSTNWDHARIRRLIRAAPSEPYASDINSMFNGGGTPLLVTNDTAIKLQILNVMSTSIGSEEFEPTFGSSLPYRLFEPINDGTALLIREDTIVALSRWMQGVIQLNISQCEIVPIIDEDMYAVNLEYYILAQQQLTTFNFNIYRP